jgi:AraC-like DNA-binding protein
MGEFRLGPADPAWGCVNTISAPGPLIAFPGTTVKIRHESEPEIVADPTRAVLYSPDQPYRRGLVSGDGDRCSYVTFSHALAAEAAAPFDRRAMMDPSRYRYPYTVADVDRGHHSLAQLVRRRLAVFETTGLRTQEESDAIREALYELVGHVTASAYLARVARPAHHRHVTRVARRSIVETVRERIGADLARPETLDEFAAHVHLSAFHLARVFREEAGRSIHGYRMEVRLRDALRRVADGERLVDVAAVSGFASQAHLTDRFGRAFGRTPFAWRTAADRIGLEMSTIVKAREVTARLA